MARSPRRWSEPRAHAVLATGCDRRRARGIDVAQLPSKLLHPGAQRYHRVRMLRQAGEVLGLVRIALEFVELPLLGLLEEVDQFPTLRTYPAVLPHAVSGRVLVV